MSHHYHEVVTEQTVNVDSIRERDLFDIDQNLLQDDLIENSQQ